MIKSSWHIQDDVLNVLDQGWTMGIFHPPCTYICYSSSNNLYKDRKKENGLVSKRWVKLMEGATFFKRILNAPIDHLCAENPVMHGRAKQIIGVSQAQCIQPYDFGDSMSKRTCLWLKNLPLLQNTTYCPPSWYHEGKPRWDNQTPHGSNNIGRQKDRGFLRSITPQGVADAMAEQWGEYLMTTYQF
jgi:hypothetical protein